MAGGNSFALVGAVAAMVAVAGGAWKASELKQEYDLRLARVDQRIAEIEAISPDNEGSSILRRITALEHTTNSLNEDTARLQADVGRVDAGASGLGGQLAERVNALESRALSGASGDSAASNASIDQITQRLGSVEARLEAMGASSVEGARAVSGAGAGPVLVNTDFRADVQGLDFRLAGCRGRSAPVCNYTIEHTTNSDIRADIDVGDSQSASHAYARSSEFLGSSRARMGSYEASDYAQFTIPAGLRIEGFIRFAQPSEPTNSIQLLRVRFRAPSQWVEFRNVPIE